MPLAHTLYITEVHRDFEGDAFFPAIDRTLWRETERVTGPPVDGLAYAYVTYVRAGS